MKASKSTIGYVLAFTLLVFSFSACKVSEEEGSGRWDADNNAMIDQNEFETAWGEANYYSRWDANRDNMIEESEWNAGRNSYMRDIDEASLGMYSDWDADGDGSLSEEEFRNRTFEIFDTDRDGSLSEEEYTAWWSGFNRGANGQ